MSGVGLSQILEMVKSEQCKHFSNIWESKISKCECSMCLSNIRKSKNIASTDSSIQLINQKNVSNSKFFKEVNMSITLVIPLTFKNEVLNSFAELMTTKLNLDGPEIKILTCPAHK